VGRDSPIGDAAFNPATISTSDDQHFYEIVTLCKPKPYQDRGRARTDGNHLARDVSELGPQLRETVTRRKASWNRRDVTHEPSAEPEWSEERVLAKRFSLSKPKGAPWHSGSDLGLS